MVNATAPVRSPARGLRQPELRDCPHKVATVCWLGHHWAASMLATHLHLLDGDVGETLTLRGPGASLATGSVPVPTAA